MKYVLSIMDRVVLAQVLQEIHAPGSFLYAKGVRQLREKTGFSKDEADRIGLKIEESRLSWKPGATADIEAEVDERLRGEIAKVLIGLDKKQQIMEEHVDVYEKFVKAEDMPKAEEAPKAEVDSEHQSGA